jgi:hypothetical protein
MPLDGGGNKLHDSVTADTDHGDGDGEQTPIVDTVPAAGSEPRKFFPRVKMLLSPGYGPVRRLHYWSVLANHIGWMDGWMDGWMLG